MKRFALGLAIGFALARFGRGLPAHCRAMIARCTGGVAASRA